MTYTDEELVAMMRAASDDFYRKACWVGHHGFIEFAGLMNKYIELCERARQQGLDFTETTVHGGGAPLPMEGHDARYLLEKLDCIYGRSLAALRTLAGPSGYVERREPES